MKLEEYFASAEFRMSRDELLREHAIAAAERIVREVRDVGLKLPGRSQLYSLYSIAQAGGIEGLVTLSSRQAEKELKKEKEKNSDTPRTGFWGRLLDLLKTKLPDHAQSVLTGLGVIMAFDHVPKNEQGRLKSLNNKAKSDYLNAIVSVYFEHFTCHYHYFIQEAKHAGTSQDAA